MTRTETLHAAEKAVNGDRQGEYGTPENNFKNIAGFWSLYLSSKLNKDITLQPVDVAVLLDLMKTARLIQSPGKTDTWIDKAGYAACGAEIVSESKLTGKFEHPYVAITKTTIRENGPRYITPVDPSQTAMPQMDVLLDRAEGETIMGSAIRRE